MQIFCDESGTINRDHFLVAAVRVESGQATRMVKAIRKVTGITRTELKGNDLTLEQIKTVFSIIARNAEAIAVSVICRRDDPVGGWAMGALQEHQIWRELIVECCLSLHSRDVQGIVPDGGRYKKAVLRTSEAKIAEAVARRSGQALVPVGCANSTTTPGIQIADMIANTVHRSFSAYPDAEACREILGRAESGGHFRMSMLAAIEQRPNWLRE